MTEFSEKEKALLRTTSIEHTINTTLRLVGRLRKSSLPAVAEDAAANWENWSAIQPLLLKLWSQALLNLHPSQPPLKPLKPQSQRPRAYKPERPRRYP